MHTDLTNASLNHEQSSAGPAKPIDGASFSYKRILRLLKVESISILTILFALVVTRGYAYLDTFNEILGVPAHRMGYDSLVYAIYGGIPFSFIAIGAFIGAAISLILISIWTFFENPSKGETIAFSEKQRQFLVRIYDIYPLIIGAFATAFLSVGIWFMWDFVYRDAQSSAKKAAYNNVIKCIEATVNLKNTDRVIGCVVGESDDMLYLIKKHTVKDGKVKFDRMRVPKTSLSLTMDTGEISNSD